MGRRATVGGKERILEFVTAYTDEYGYSPTYREICDATGYKSSSTARRYISQLEQEGKLALCSRRTRTVKPVRNVRIHPSNGEAQHRVKLQMADGGTVSFDCVLDKDIAIPVDLKFSGVLDATQIKSKLGRLVSCSIDDEEE